MELIVLANKPNELEFILKGERHTLPNLLRSTLLEDSSVTFAAYTMHHPLDKDTKFIVKTKGKNAKKALGDALKSIDSELSELKKAVKKCLR